MRVYNHHSRGYDNSASTCVDKRHLCAHIYAEQKDSDLLELEIVIIICPNKYNLTYQEVPFLPCLEQVGNEKGYNVCDIQDTNSILSSAAMAAT
ncbi:hypothetical protein STEG23_011489 [Scotinomys teguina]